MVEPDAVLEVTDRVLDLGVTAGTTVAFAAGDALPPTNSSARSTTNATAMPTSTTMAPSMTAIIRDRRMVTPSTDWRLIAPVDS